jgi:cyanoexosortase A
MVEGIFKHNLNTLKLKMKQVIIPQLWRLKSLPFWLLGIASGLTGVQLTLTWRADDADLFASSILFLFVTASQIKDKQKTLTFESGVIATLTGLFLIAIALLRSINRPTANFLALLPVLAGLGVALLASGFKGLRQYRQELIILAFLGLPRVVVPIVFDPTLLTAKFGTLILYYLGFQVYRDGFFIHLPTGSVEVYEGCSGIQGIVHLLSLSGLFLMMIPLGWLKRFVVVVAAVAIAFGVNGFRVALMAHLVAARDMKAFDYWHQGNGSLIFSVLAVIVFGGFCWLMMKLNERQTDEAETEWEWDEVGEEVEEAES